MFLFCINYYLCVYINITRDCIVLQKYDVIIYCQEYGIVTGCRSCKIEQSSDNKTSEHFSLSHETFKHKIIHILPLYDLL